MFETGERLDVGGEVGVLQIEARLGEGMAGVVYQCRRIKGGGDTSDRNAEFVALKLYRAELMAMHGQAERVSREAEATARVCNPNIVGVLALVETGLGPGLVMEYIDGPTLREFMQTGQLDPIGAGKQLLNGVAALHRAGVVHRDLKPENILIESSTGRVKIADFGVAHIEDSVSVTETNAFLGTIRYGSPEYLLDGLWSIQADQYSAGLILLECLLGCPPVTGQGTFARQVLEVSERQPPSIDQFQVSTLEDLIRAWTIRRLLAKDPLERFESTDIALDAFRAPRSSAIWRRTVQDWEERVSKLQAQEAAELSTGRATLAKMSSKRIEVERKESIQYLLDRVFELEEIWRCPVCDGGLDNSCGGGGELGPCGVCGYFGRMDFERLRTIAKSTSGNVSVPQVLASCQLLSDGKNEIREIMPFLDSAIGALAARGESLFQRQALTHAHASM